MSVTSQNNEAFKISQEIDYRSSSHEDGCERNAQSQETTFTETGISSLTANLVDNEAVNSQKTAAMSDSDAQLLANGVTIESKGVRATSHNISSDCSHHDAETTDKLPADTLDQTDSITDKERETWGSKLDFLLSIIGFAVDLANVWRFPYFCYKNGGGAFLIPYFTMLLLGALPLFYMEVLLGQFHKQGAISLWKIVPLFKGVGWTTITISYLVSFYYNTIIAWSLFYFFSSFTANLPWTTCGNEWNTCRCVTTDMWTQNYTNVTLNCSDQIYNLSSGISSTSEYFERRVLQVQHSEDISDLGSPRWDLTLCLILTYCILYFALWKGVKTSGKVVYVTAIMPYVILLILFIRGLFLEGATKGLYYFGNPVLTRLNDPMVWVDAAVQVFYSVGAGFGVHLTMASYNKFNNNCYKDILITAGVNSFTSLFAGCVVFIYLGFMSETMHKPIEEVASQGYGLVFEVYPQAISTLKGSTAWSLLFFFMLIMLGMDSSMGGFESVATGIIDEYKHFFHKYKYHREIFTAVLIVFSFCCALPTVTSGGLYVLQLLDMYTAGTSLLLVVLLEAVAIAWFYGLDQFLEDAKMMLGFKPGIYWRICWKFIGPIFFCSIIVANIISYAPLVSPLSDRTVIHPEWSNMVGWSIVIINFLFVPLIAIYTVLAKFAHSPSLSRRFALCISPESEHTAILAGKPVKRLTSDHWLSMKAFEIKFKLKRQTYNTSSNINECSV